MTAIKIPMKRDGGLWLKPPHAEHPNLVWEDSTEFEADMKLVGFLRTAKGDFFLWADQATNATYPMISEELYSAALKSMPDQGMLNGVWTVVQSKHGFSLRLLKELEPPVGS